MIYCEICARILDEDVQFCPICNEEDPDWNHQSPNVSDNEPVRAFRGEVFDRLREINQNIEKKLEPGSNQSSQSDQSNQPNQSDQPGLSDLPKEEPGVGLYLLMITLSVCLSFVGLVMGIVYLTKKNENYRTLGVITVAVSVIFLLFGLMFSFAVLMLL